MTTLSILLANWKYIAIGTLLATIGLQTHRLQRAQGEIVIYEERERVMLLAQEERERRAKLNKERTDEEYASALRRADAARVRVKPAAGTVVAQASATAGSGEQAAESLKRGDIDRAVSKFAVQHAARLNDVIAEVSQRFADELTRAARETEELAAAYRACRAFALNVE